MFFDDSGRFVLIFFPGKAIVSLDFDVIGPYNVIRILGQGGMGTVYHGVHAKTQDPVAIKVIASSMAQHQRFRRRFDSEIQTLLKLKHPNIVQLIGFGEERGLLFYSMEYVDGENLQQQLRREKRMPWERVVDIAIEICAALKHAHDFGIVHRDLKPANIMINSQGQVKLTDFGIAKLFGAADATVEGSVLGTADFMPPEQAEGKPVSVRSDLYSLGSMCYAAIAGRTPFVGKTIPEILFNVRYGSLTPLGNLVPDVPQELCDLIEELLRREPSMRPPTGLVVGNRLQALRLGLAMRSKERNSSKTSVGNVQELTSIDLSENPSVADIVPGDGTQVRFSSPAAKHKSPGPVDGQTKATIATNKTQNSGVSVAGPDDKTRIALSNSGFELQEIPSGIDEIGRTNFTEVQDDDRRRSSIVADVDATPSVWTQWISIGSLAILLVACAVAIVIFSQSPSANSLYRDIVQSVDAGTDDAMVDCEPTLDRFAALYPNDPRIDEVRGLQTEVKTIVSIRKLQKRARGGSLGQLDAVEQAYLEFVKANEFDPIVARRKLSALITVFDGNDQLSLKQKQIVAMAKRTLEKLDAAPPTSNQMARESLAGQMRWAEGNLSPALHIAWLKSFIELYGEISWANDFVQQARDQLALLERSR